MDNKELVPTLTLEGTDTETALENAPQAVAVASDDAFDKEQFSEAELKQIEDFSKQIDLTNSNQIMQYGAAAQKKTSAFSEAALKNVRTKEFGEVGSLLSELTTEVRGFGETDKKGFLGLFQKSRNKIESIRAKYADSETNINRISKALETHQFTLLKDISMLDKLYEQNKVYFRELSMYIAAGKQRLADVRANELVELQNKAKESGLPEDAQAANDLASMCKRFENKIHDLELTRTITLQSAPQIRMVQQDDTMMAEKIQSTLNNTIPLWKNQMVLALGVAHAEEAAKAQQLVTNATNEMLKENADKLKDATVMAAQENERAIVDIETLEHTNNQLISTIEEVMKIQAEGAERRRTAEAELVRIEEELKTKLLAASGKAPEENA